MKCPYCEYEDRPAPEYEENKEGRFYELTNEIQMERSTSYWAKEKATVYGCPVCKKVFID